ncbi:MAG: alanine--tRNA ligase [Holosporales bacterium]|jgi:alanyl-tRNA synthetase|nr:alanine--tRNA ligase [Holosporales bacterium]
MTLDGLREAFLNHFSQNGHTIIPSSSLVPADDPTLLFVNAGMVQFKDIFTGKKMVNYSRAITAQKCVRAGGKHNDLDNVGYTSRHHTFFEMLGNFSFGDYFKEEAICLAWKFIHDIIRLPKDKLLITVHTSDEEAASIWKKVAGLEDSRIIRISTNDNFWSMGDEGPCGPCSEIFYDHGPEVSGGPPGSPDSDDGDRFVEIWNLVFMQFDRLNDGRLIPLPKPSIDTGMGLERFAAVLQGVHSNYEVDLFKSLISEIKSVTGTDEDSLSGVPYNVIADHIRAISFLVADGVLPSNEGRGYVLRRIIRRALRYGHALGLLDPFLYKLVPRVRCLMGGTYPELSEAEKVTIGVLQNEEAGFMSTLDKGMHILKSEIAKMGAADTFSAELAYRLYDTYGFPFDMTRDALRQVGKTVNEEEFELIVGERKLANKGTFVGSGGSFVDQIWYDLAASTNLTAASFKPGKRQCRAEILSIVKGDTLLDEIQSCSSTCSDIEFAIVTSQTPFYAESGGQAGDRGKIFAKSSEGDEVIVDVLDTVVRCGLNVHLCLMKEGRLGIGDEVEMVVDWGRRVRAARNHTATHILHSALREILGDHVRQKGSSVNDERLRFDFIHHESINLDQLTAIESIVSRVINDDLEVTTEEMPLNRARSTGAMALFGERYPDFVRVVTIGNAEMDYVFSKEICGGEHVHATSQIGCFKVVAIASVGAGIKRIEAVTGPGLLDHFNSQILENSKKIEIQSANLKKYEKEVCDLRRRTALKEIQFQSVMMGEILFRHAILENTDKKIILELIDREKMERGKRCLVIGQVDRSTNRAAICLFISRELVCENLDSRHILKQVLERVGARVERVGGREELAQAGGIDPSILDKVITAPSSWALILRGKP